MSGLISWFAHNRVAANLLMLAIVAAGLIMAPSLGQEIFPEVKMGMIAVNVVQPGASPAEIEETILLKLEEAIHDLEGVHRVTSGAWEGFGTVAAELEYGADSRKLLDDIKARVDNIENLPADAEPPLVSELESFKNAIDIALAGDIGERPLRALAERVREDLLDLPNVSHVVLSGVRPFEIGIEVSERDLRRFGLTFDSVVTAVRNASLDRSSGTLRTPDGELKLRTTTQARSGRDFEELVLLSRPDGTHLELHDIARVTDGFEDSHQAARFDGVPAVLIQVHRAGDERVLDVVHAVLGYVESASAEMPAGVELTVWRDESVQLRAKLSLMLENGAYGLALVLLTLSLFLRPRLAFWVSVGIPVSMLGALSVLTLFDVTLNVISLMAFIVALGLVVDDAIVVGDAIAAEQEISGSGIDSALRGVSKVAVPVIVAAVTSMLMLVPVFSLGGVGQQGHPLPAVVIGCLVFSLIESLLVLPAHLAHRRRKSTEAAKRRGLALGLTTRWQRIPRFCRSGLERFIEFRYRPLLRRAIDAPGLTLAAGATVLLLTFGAVSGGWIPFTFLPDVEGDYVTAALTMPEGTSAEQLDAVVLHLEATAREVQAEFNAQVANGHAFEHSFTSIGSQPEKLRQSFFDPLSWRSLTGRTLAEVQLALVPREERSFEASAVAERWRALAGEIPDAVELLFPVTLFSTGDPINIQLEGADEAQLRRAAHELEDALRGFAGVYEIANSGRSGARELRLVMRPEAEALGLNSTDLARQLRQGFHGAEVQRVSRGRHDIPVVVRYPAAERHSFRALDEVRIRTADGAEVPLAIVADVELAWADSSIHRADRKRTLHVTADVDATVANSTEIISRLKSDVLPHLLADHAGISYSLEGHQREQGDFFASFLRGYLMGLLAIFALLAVTLRSYIEPLIVLLAVPFGIAGACIGHAVFQTDITMYTLIGVLGVTGVVVNDSLVLLHAIAARRDAGAPLADAALEGCTERFRPVILTTLTTFLGLLPLLLERSTHAQELKPMATALAFGEIVSTGVVLLIVPVAWVVIERVRTRMGLERSGASVPDTDRTTSNATVSELPRPSLRNVGT